MILRDYSVTTAPNLLCKCEEILFSRKREQLGRTFDYDCNYVISIPEGVPSLYWWFCLLKYLSIFHFIISDTIRDCQVLQNLIQKDGCASRCPIMNSTLKFEYLCSCHQHISRVSLDDPLMSSVLRWTTSITTLTTA